MSDLTLSEYFGLLVIALGCSFFIWILGFWLFFATVVGAVLLVVPLAFIPDPFDRHSDELERRWREKHD